MHKAEHIDELMAFASPCSCNLMQERGHLTCARQWEGLAASLEGEVGASCRSLGPRMLCLHLLTATSPPLLLLLNLSKICSQVQGASPLCMPAARYSKPLPVLPAASAAAPSSLPSLQWYHRGRSLTKV